MVRPLQDQVDIFGPGGSLDVIKGSRPAFQQFSSPAETAAAQQAFQYASAGGGAPRAELVMPPTPAVQVAWDQAQAFQRQSELDTLNNMFSQAKNLPDLYRRLDQPIPGSFDKLSGTNIGVVTDPGRLAAQVSLRSLGGKSFRPVWPSIRRFHCFGAM